MFGYFGFSSAYANWRFNASGFALSEEDIRGFALSGQVAPSSILSLAAAGYGLGVYFFRQRGRQLRKFTSAFEAKLAALCLVVV